MKTIQLLFLAAISFAGWHCQSAPDQTTDTPADTLTLEDINPVYMPDIYTQAQLISFMDSLSKENPAKWEAEAQKFANEDYADLKWDGKKDMDKTTLLQFKKAMAGSEIHTELAQKWLPDLDSQWVSLKKIPLRLHYGKANSPAGPWIFSLGDQADMEWDAMIYFLSEKGLLAHRNVMHRYGLGDIASFKGPNGFPIVHFRVNFDSGTGVWRWNEYYYEFRPDTVIPVFNHLQNSNLAHYSYRNWWWETTLVSQDPFRLKVVAHISLPDTADVPNNFFSDSTFVEPVWNAAVNQYEWPYQPPVWTQMRMLSFVQGETEQFLFLLGYKDLIMEGLQSEDPTEQHRVRNYLQYVVYSLRHPYE